MSLLTAPTTIGDIKRARDIAGILFEEGFGFILDQTKLRWLVPLECRIRCFFGACAGMVHRKPPQDLPVRFRKLLIRLGPTFVKFGQVMSLRPDILPPEICNELAKLTNQVPPVPFGEAKTIIEEELKQPLHELFKDFEKTPIAAASLAQVYKAKLKNGQTVAVKVQRPGIRKVIEKDIHILLYLGATAVEQIPELAVYRPIETVREFADTIMRELDFTVEAIHAKRFAAMFAEDPSVKVAQVFEDYSTSRVLTMEFIDGIPVTDTQKLKRANIDLILLAKNGVNALLKEVFIEGFFHADPHPGNYFALPGNVFAFIDYGMAGRLTRKDRLELASLFMSFLNEDSENAIAHMKHLVEVTESSNITSFEHEMDDTLHQWFGAKLREVSLAQTFFRIINSGRKNRVYFPTSLVFLSKALFTTEAMGLRLDPEFDFTQKMRPFIKEFLKAELNPKKLATHAADRAIDYASYLESLPEMTVNLLTKIDKGEIGVRINREELRELEIRLSTDDFKKFAITVAGAGIMAFIVAYVMQKGILPIHVSTISIGLVFFIILLLWGLRK